MNRGFFIPQKHLLYMGAFQVEFKANKEADKDSGWYFLNHQWKSRADRVYYNYKGLKEEMDAAEDKRKAFSDYVDRFYEKNNTTVEECAEKFQKAWDAVNDPIFEALQEVMEIRTKPFTAKCYMHTHGSSSPRYLDTRRMLTYYNQPVENVMSVVTHELIHFIYFEKWKEIFPEHERITYDSPYLQWCLSEVLVFSIERDERISKIVPTKDTGYGEWQRIIRFENGLQKNIFHHYFSLYEKNLAEKTSFADFLKFCWQDVQQFKDELKAK